MSKTFVRKDFLRETPQRDKKLAVTHINFRVYLQFEKWRLKPGTVPKKECERSYICFCEDTRSIRELTMFFQEIHS